MTERRIVLPWAGLALLAALLFALKLRQAWPTGDDDLQWVIFENAVLPRAAVAILAGAALGLACGLLVAAPVVESVAVG